ncbi:hypothetical protein TrVE_jg2143 [Triparma verrucosa]|nr:hypothetical protein TrVE_jg2143 [Triparma verrucosa]
MVPKAGTTTTPPSQALPPPPDRSTSRASQSLSTSTLNTQLDTPASSTAPVSPDFSQRSNSLNNSGRKKKRAESKLERLSLSLFGRSNKRAFSGASPDKPRSRSSSNRKNTVTDDHIDHIGETVIDHVRRLILPSLISLSDQSYTSVSHFATPLISDAMHLRSIYSHRWNPLALSFYKLRNSHTYRNMMFVTILLHTCSIAFVPPRGSWESVSTTLRLFEEEEQTQYLNIVNYCILAVYILDLLIQAFYQHIYWSDVDWASDYVKKTSKASGRAKKAKGHVVSTQNVKRYRTSIEQKSESIRTTARSMRADKSTFVRLKLLFNNLRLYSYNSIFILNTIVVAAMFFSTIFDVPSQCSFLRPIMFIFINYRLQTAAGAMMNMFPELSDMLIIVCIFLLLFSVLTAIFIGGSYEIDTYPEEGFGSFFLCLLNYYVLLSTESFPQLIGRFGNTTDTGAANLNFNLTTYNNIGYLFTAFLVLGYFVLLAYMTAIVFDGYYNVKIKISLQEYLTERSALAAAFLTISWDPVGGEFNDALTLGDLLEANIRIHGAEAGFHMTAELFEDLDRDQNGSLDENEFYSFCDAVCQMVEKRSYDAMDSAMDESFSEDPINRNTSTDSMTDSGRTKKRPKYKTILSNARRWYRNTKENLVEFVRPLIPEEGSHILFNHILELFRSGLIQVFFLLACIWIYMFAVMGMFVLGKEKCIDASLAHKDLEEIPYYERFDTFQNSMLTMFRMATGSGWHEIMFLYWKCESPWGGHNFVPAFFVTFHFTFCIVFYNVLGGLIYAHYKQMENTTLVDDDDDYVRDKKKKKKKSKRKKKKNKKTLASRNSTAIPEMRKSARFWREAMEQGGGDEEGPGGVRPRVGSLNPTSPGISRMGTGRNSMGSFEGMTKMEDLYEQHLVTQQIHKTAHKNFNYNPWSSKVLAGMAERLLRPNVGMRWDVTIIDKKTDGEINADGKEDDRRQRANSAGGIFSALRLRSSTHSTVSTTKTPPPQKKSAMKAQGGGSVVGEDGVTVTVANRRSSWLKSMGVMSSARHAQTKAGWKAPNAGSGQSVGIEMQDKRGGGDGDKEGEEEEPRRRNYSFDSDKFDDEEEDSSSSSSSDGDSSEDERRGRRGRRSKGRKGLRRSLGGNVSRSGGSDVVL